jgi:nucleotide-binding universal stress UspA family protein
VYTEHPNVPASREGAAFHALVEALRRPHIRTLITPTPEHFSRSGAMYQATCTAIAVETGADLVMMSEYGKGAS